MKKLYLLLISFCFIIGLASAQKALSSEEKIAKNIRSQTEVSLRKLFNNNGYTTGLFLNGYPKCLEGYVFYSTMLKMTGEKAITFPNSQKIFSIEKGKIISFSEEKWNCEIVFTLTAKDINSNDCIAFIGTNGWVYIFNIFKFDKVVPISLDLATILFASNKLDKAFSFVVTDNSTKEKNSKHDFSGFSKDLNCKAFLNYDYVAGYFEGMAAVELNNKWGFVDSIGNEIVEPRYDGVSGFAEGLAWIELGEKYGFIDKSGKEILPLRYERANQFSEGLALIKQNGKFGFIDKTGKTVIYPKYELAFNYKESMAQVKLGGKWGYTDKTGNEIISLQYDDANAFSEGLARVCVNGLYGFTDKSGKLVIQPKYDNNTGDFSDGLVKVKIDGKYGFIDKTEQIIISPTFDGAGNFSEGLAPVKRDGKYGYIDKNGKEVIPFQYDYANSFSKGSAVVMLNYVSFSVDKTGKEIKN